MGASPELVYDVSANSGWLHLTAIDVDGDNGAELVMFHPSNGTWWVVDGDGSTPVYLWGQFTTRHEASGRVWILRGGETFGLRYLGDLVAGSTEREWLIATSSDTFGLLALTRE